LLGSPHLPVFMPYTSRFQKSDMVAFAVTSTSFLGIDFAAIFLMARLQRAGVKQPLRCMPWLGATIERALKLDNVFQVVGAMFWFTWKKLSGSYLALTFCRRS
jgi:hypothetical protein